MKIIINNLVLGGLLSLVNSQFHTKLLKGEGINKECLILSTSDNVTFKPLDQSADEAVIVQSKQAQSPLNADKVLVNDHSQILDIYSKSRNAIESYINGICSRKSTVEPLKTAINGEMATPEIRKIVDNGNSKNRIDVVFMGDGYTAAEKSKFFGDIQRLTKDMFEGPTFKSWLPLFNIWAIHVDSTDSGIGYNGPKNTPFKLYRESGQLRAIFPGNAAYARQVCKLTGDAACDYPSLIANDDYYGGLGGEFVISTKSVRTGTVVLRHEMGHNFINVGEEYDDGSVYSGVNSSPTLNVGWKAWLSGPLKEQKAMYRLLEYPWHDLSKGPKSFEFQSDGLYKRWYMQVSVTAAGDSDCLEFTLDGKVLPWQTRGSDDREFYDFFGTSGFTKGKHILSVRSKKPPTSKEIPRMLAMVTLHEFGDESEFKVSNDYYNAYPTWNESRKKSYRPTNEKCIMRNMTSSSFCNVCKEGMWYQFLQKISLIDNLAVTGNKATLTPIKLGQFRSTKVNNEKLTITWKLNNVIQPKYNDLLDVKDLQPGSWSVTVKFTTDEIRSDPKGLTVDTKEFNI